MNFDLSFFNRPLVPQMLCVFGLLMVLLLLLQQKPLFGVQQQANVTVAKFNQETPNIYKTLNSPIFGHYASVNERSGLKESALAAEIMGIIHSSEPSQSQVLLRLNNEERSFKMGEALPGGAVVKQIEADKIIVLYQGALEVLNLPKNELRFEKPDEPLLFKE